MEKDFNKFNIYNKVFYKIPFSKDLIKVISVYFGTNMLVLIIQAVSSLLVTRMVLPEHMGSYLTASIFLTYIPFLTLGINNGLNRHLPFLNGIGERDKAISLSSTAFTWSIIIGILIFIISVSLSAHSFYASNITLGIAFIGVGVIGALSSLTQMIESTYKTNNDFSSLSKSKIYTSLIAILTIPIVHFWEFIGYNIRSSIIAIFNTLILITRSKIKTSIKFDKKDFTQLFRIGMPIFIFGYFHTIYLGLDKILIANYLTERDMGLYAPALQICAALSILPNSIFQILYPKMCRKFAETGRVSSLSKMAFKPIVYLGIGLIPIFGMGCWLVGPFVHYILPKYVEGIPAARWMVIAIYCWCLGSAQDVLTTIGKFRPFTIALILSCIIYFIVFELLIKMNWGLSAVSASFALSIFTFNAVITYSVYLIIRKEQSLKKDER